jgi:hypothetical protein
LRQAKDMGNKVKKPVDTEEGTVMSCPEMSLLINR